MIALGTPIVFRTIRGAFRGRLAADVVASLSIIGAVILSQPLAGLVIVLMQTGGEALESYAEGRASAAVKSLEEAAPRVAHVVRGAAVEDVPASEVVPNDVLVIGRATSSRATAWSSTASPSSTRRPSLVKLLRCAPPPAQPS